MKKTISSLLMIPVLALGLGSCKNYKIDNSKVQTPVEGIFSWNVREVKSSGEEIYYFNDQVHITDNLVHYKRYYFGSPVFEQAKKREKYVLKKIDSIKNAEMQKDMGVLKK